MTIDVIIHALKTAKTLPKEPLRAGVAEAKALTPTILDLAEKVARGVYLLPRDGQLLFYGLHILAAARETRLCPVLLEIVCVPWDDHQRLVSECDTDEVAHLVLSVYDGDEAAFLAALEDAETDPYVRSILIETLERLTCDGRIARAHTTAFLERFEQEPLAEEDDFCWADWADAVVHLGLVDLEPALRRVWQKPGFGALTESARQEALKQMAAAAADPSNPQWFIDDGITPITDPVAELEWLEETGPADAEGGIEEEGRAEPGRDDDPAAAIRLTPDEGDWLEGFLVSRQPPETTMDLEMLDGFFTALVIGPDAVAPSEYMPVVWGTDDGKGPIYDSAEQAEFVTALLTRHWNTIAARLDAGYLHPPLLQPVFEDPDGTDQDEAAVWAAGFLLGVAMRQKSWKRCLESMDDDSAEQFGSILMLAEDDAVLAERNITPEVRTDMVMNLPHSVFLLHQFFRRLEETPALLSRQPLRSTKVGRNQPCPCGSGKKYKHCCGSGQAPSVH